MDCGPDTRHAFGLATIRGRHIGLDLDEQGYPLPAARPLAEKITYLRTDSLVVPRIFTDKLFEVHSYNLLQKSMLIVNSLPVLDSIVGTSVG